MTTQAFHNPELFDEAYINEIAAQEARSAAIGAASYATTLLEHSKIYRRKTKLVALIADVQQAIYLSWLPANEDQSKQVRELVSDISSQNFAKHFLRAWRKGAPQLASTIEAHGLYFVGLAALSQSKPGDSVVAICHLLCMINTWNAGQAAQGKKKAAGVLRKPEREFIKKIILEMIKSEAQEFDKPKISVRRIWDEAKRQNNYPVPFNRKYFKFSSCLQNGDLHVDFFETDNLGEDLEKTTFHESWTYDQFNGLVGKLKIEINEESDKE